MPRTAKEHAYALYLAAHDPRVPTVAKLVIGFLLAYLLSPIDLIPDFIPVLGLLDDAVLVPLGIWLVRRLTPAVVWEDAVSAARRGTPPLPCRRRAVVAIIAIWVLAGSALAIWLGG